jgi:flagellar hook-associated protein FlgK
MNVGFASALNGLTSYQRRAADAADNIIKQTSEIEESSEAPSLEESVAELAVSEVGYKANVKVLKTQDEMLGSLLDILA